MRRSGGYGSKGKNQLRRIPSKDDNNNNFASSALTTTSSTSSTKEECNGTTGADNGTTAATTGNNANGVRSNGQFCGTNNNACSNDDAHNGVVPSVNTATSQQHYASTRRERGRDVSSGGSESRDVIKGEGGTRVNHSRDTLPHVNNNSSYRQMGGHKHRDREADATSWRRNSNATSTTGGMHTSGTPPPPSFMMNSGAVGQHHQRDGTNTTGNGNQQTFGSRPPRVQRIWRDRGGRNSGDGDKGDGMDARQHQPYQQRQNWKCPILPGGDQSRGTNTTGNSNASAAALPRGKEKVNMPTPQHITKATNNKMDNTTGMNSTSSNPITIFRRSFQEGTEDHFDFKLVLDWFQNRRKESSGKPFRVYEVSKETSFSQPMSPMGCNTVATGFTVMASPTVPFVVCDPVGTNWQRMPPCNIPVAGGNDASVVTSSAASPTIQLLRNPHANGKPAMQNHNGSGSIRLLGQTPNDEFHAQRKMTSPPWHAHPHARNHHREGSHSISLPYGQSFNTTGINTTGIYNSYPQVYGGVSLPFHHVTPLPQDLSSGTTGSFAAVSNSKHFPPLVATPDYPPPATADPSLNSFQPRNGKHSRRGNNNGSGINTAGNNSGINDSSGLLPSPSPGETTVSQILPAGSCINTTGNGTGSGINTTGNVKGSGINTTGNVKGSGRNTNKKERQKVQSGQGEGKKLEFAKLEQHLIGNGLQCASLDSLGSVTTIATPTQKSDTGLTTNDDLVNNNGSGINTAGNLAIEGNSDGADGDCGETWKKKLGVSIPPVTHLDTLKMSTDYTTSKDDVAVLGQRTKSDVCVEVGWGNGGAEFADSGGDAAGGVVGGVVES